MPQNIYPYAYLVRDIGKEGQTFTSLLPDAKKVTSETSKILFRQWSLFWDTAKPVLLEKTPENLLMGEYLQTTFGKRRTKFAFVMRHPLIWALAIEKWVAPDFVALRTVEDRISFWFECMSRALKQLPMLRDVIVLQLEAMSASLDMQLSVSRHLLCGDMGENLGTSPPSIRRPSGIAASTAILSSSLAYVTCWLAGMEYKTSSKRCIARRTFREPAFGMHTEHLAAENRWRLQHIASIHEVQANTFGYSFKPFEKLAALPSDRVLRARILGDQSVELAAQVGIHTHPSLISFRLRPHLVTAVPRLRGAPPLQPVANTARHVLLAYHKMGFDNDKPTGMDIRMGQIMQSLIGLHIHVHFLCHCNVDPSQLLPFGRGVTIYAGSMLQQYKQAIAAPLRHAFIFFTTLTMTVHQRMLQGDAEWYLEPNEPLPEEHLQSWLSHDFPQHSVCTIAVADDIHYLRATEVMGRYNPVKAEIASAWIRRRELGFHASVDTVVTVSQEDRASLEASLREAPRARRLLAGPDIREFACVSCTCNITWVPYIVDTADRARVEPFDSRQNGMLYVGGMHGLALIAIEWLVQHVQRAISEQAPSGAAELLFGGMGHLHLAGPGWTQHFAESRALNQSVSIGHVTLLGILSDLQLEKRLQQHKVFAAPVLNGTGIATKNVLAMARGIPLVTTSVGLNGLGLPMGQRAVLAADDPGAFALNVLRIQTSPEDFEASWRAALQHADTFLSSHRQQELLRRILRWNSINASTLATPDTLGEEASLCDGRATLGGGGLHTAQDEFLAQARQAKVTKRSLPLVLLGLGGAGGSFVASRLHTRHACFVPDPLRGISHAPLEAQLDHLSSILHEPSLCQVCWPRARQAQMGS